LRREPEGIEHEKSPKPSSELLGGHYDHMHSQEYDPYESAQRQMQELLFGTVNNHSNNDNNNTANLRPSSNSAFQVECVLIEKFIEFIEKLLSITSINEFEFFLLQY
jgi:hypothetical protein